MCEKVMFKQKTIPIEGNFHFQPGKFEYLLKISSKILMEGDRKEPSNAHFALFFNGVMNSEWMAFCDTTGQIPCLSDLKWCRNIGRTITTQLRLSQFRCRNKSTS